MQVVENSLSPKYNQTYRMRLPVDVRDCELFVRVFDSDHEHRKKGKHSSEHQLNEEEANFLGQVDFVCFALSKDS